jgi:hypothetical protein
MSNNAVQPIETSHYTYDAHKPTTTNNKQDPTHHSAAQPTASKIHPVVDKPIEHPHAAPTTATSAVTAASTQHPHAAERPHPVAEHAQPAVVQHLAHPTASQAVVPLKEKETPKNPQVEAAKSHSQATPAVVTPKDKETPKHAQSAAVEHPQTGHPQNAIPSQTAPAAATTPQPHVAFEHPIVVAVIEDEEQPRPHHHHHHNRSHNHHSQYEQGEQPHHKHDYDESPHAPHPAAGHSTPTPTPTTANANANDAPTIPNSIPTEPSQANTSYIGGVEQKQTPHAPQPAAHPLHPAAANHPTSPPTNNPSDSSSVGGVERKEHPEHKPAYIETPHHGHPAHDSIPNPRPAAAAHHNTNANDALISSDSILTESRGSSASYIQGGSERRHSWNKDEMKREVMHGLLETEGKKKVAKGGYSSTSPH